MTETVGLSQFCRMLQGGVSQIRANHEMLSRLDSAVGDGDHGTSMLRAMEAVEKQITENPTIPLKDLLSKIAWAVMAIDGGSTGPLLGSFYMGMSDAAGEKVDLDQSALIQLFEAGIAKLQSQSRAKVGDKTMMDAFLPALDAMKNADSAGGVKAALQQAAQAAAAGAEATRNMRAKFGRARNLGDRTLGHPDPGAVSISLLFKGFSEAF